jgi:hypothetical protein
VRIGHSVNCRRGRPTGREAGDCRGGRDTARSRWSRCRGLVRRWWLSRRGGSGQGRCGRVRVCAVRGGMPCGPIVAGGQQARAERGVAGRCGKAAGQSAPGRDVPGATRRRDRAVERHRIGGEGGADTPDPRAEREKGGH